MTAPVLLIHGLGSSFRHGWVDTGWVDVLAGEGREVIGGDLLGHGNAERPADPAAYDDLEGLVAAGIGAHPVIDAVGFSIGARILLTVASREPARFRRIVVLGAGRNIFSATRRDDLADAVENGVEPTDEDPFRRALARLGDNPRNDRRALAAMLRRDRPLVTVETLARITASALVVIGEHDVNGPADRLAAAIPNAELVTLPGTDHFGTPRDLRAMEAAMEFLTQP